GGEADVVGGGSAPPGADRRQAGPVRVGGAHGAPGRAPAVGPGNPPAPAGGRRRGGDVPRPGGHPGAPRDPAGGAPGRGRDRVLRRAVLRLPLADASPAARPVSRDATVRLGAVDAALAPPPAFAVRDLPFAYA